MCSQGRSGDRFHSLSTSASLAVLTAIADLPVLHLNLTVLQDFILGSEQEAIQILRSFQRLKTIHIHMCNVRVTSFLPAAIRACFESAPHLEELEIFTATTPVGPSETTTAPASSLFSGNGIGSPSQLCRLRIDGPAYIVDSALPSHLDLHTIQQLVLAPPTTGQSPVIEEGFWFRLAETARR